MKVDSETYFHPLDVKLTLAAQEAALLMANSGGLTIENASLIVDQLLGEALIKPSAPTPFTVSHGFDTRRYVEVWNGVPASQRHLDEVSPVIIVADRQMAKGFELTDRELQVAACLISFDNLQKNVARRLKIGKNTVNNHLQHLYRKIGVNNDTQAAIRTLRSGLFKFVE